MPEVIHAASDAGDYEAFALLVGAYVDWCRTRYADLGWFVEEAFGHQGLEAELAALPTSYGPPSGKTLLVRSDHQVCGGGAYRRLPDGSCEMKRLFVANQFKGRGFGRKLCAALISSARDEGYELIRLDTGNRLTEAISMYKSFGFKDCAPHHEYPTHLTPYLVFMELPITQSKGSANKGDIS